jgi:hypothetical protein
MISCSMPLARGCSRFGSASNPRDLVRPARLFARGTSRRSWAPRWPEPLRGPQIPATGTLGRRRRGPQNGLRAEDARKRTEGIAFAPSDARVAAQPKHGNDSPPQDADRHPRTAPARDDRPRIAEPHGRRLCISSPPARRSRRRRHRRPATAEPHGRKPVHKFASALSLAV